MSGASLQTWGCSVGSANVGKVDWPARQSGQSKSESPGPTASTEYATFVAWAVVPRLQDPWWCAACAKLIESMSHAVRCTKMRKRREGGLTANSPLSMGRSNRVRRATAVCS
jgi:hypothetical protein